MKIFDIIDIKLVLKYYLKNNVNKISNKNKIKLKKIFNKINFNDLPIDIISKIMSFNTTPV